MRAPRTIVYQGVRYVRAETPQPHPTPHKRCQPNPQTGELSHWNEKQKKCMPLPRKLRDAVSAAHTASQEARISTSTASMGHQQGSLPATIAKHHAHAAGKHDRAAGMHTQVAQQLVDEGFTEKSLDHRRHRSEHASAAAAHHDGKLPGQW
jgi:hypothetical protein